jgi:hypothetical protein
MLLPVCKRTRTHSSGPAPPSGTGAAGCGGGTGGAPWAAAAAPSAGGAGRARTGRFGLGRPLGGRLYLADQGGDILLPALPGGKRALQAAHAVQGSQQRVGQTRAVSKLAGPQAVENALDGVGQLEQRLVADGARSALQGVGRAEQGSNDLLVVPAPLQLQKAGLERL